MTPPLPTGFLHCPRFPGYAVNADGEVISCRRPNASYGDKWRKRKTHAVAGRCGVYEQIALCINGRSTITTTHRLVLEAFRGPCPEGHETRHINGNSLDNRLANLEWGTRKANSDDKRRHGTMQSGARNGQAKLTPKQVEQIRALRPTRKITDLAREFDVSTSQVKRIIYGKSWA